jgi:hypothetical protein
VLIAVDVNSQLAAICTPSRFDMHISINAARLSLSTMITAIAISMPCCRLKAIAIVLSDVHFGAAVSTT